MCVAGVGGGVAARSRLVMLRVGKHQTLGRGGRGERRGRWFSSFNRNLHYRGEVQTRAKTEFSHLVIFTHDNTTTIFIYRYQFVIIGIKYHFCMFRVIQQYTITILLGDRCYA